MIGLTTRMKKRLEMFLEGYMVHYTSERNRTLFRGLFLNSLKQYRIDKINVAPYQGLLEKVYDNKSIVRSEFEDLKDEN